MHDALVCLIKYDRAKRLAKVDILKDYCNNSKVRIKRHIVIDTLRNSLYKRTNMLKILSCTLNSVNLITQAGLHVRVNDISPAL